MKITKTKKGFTLIELLIVIAIIGILFAALVPTILNAPAKARDGARQLNLNSIATAVEGYNVDYGQYPAGDGCIAAVFVEPGTTNSVAQNYFSGGNVPEDPSGTRSTTQVPNDPGTCLTTGTYYYRYIGDPAIGQYILAAAMELEDSNNSTSNATIAQDTGCTTGCNIFILLK